ncbi:PucR family transcriptional regulator [Staphylospora marina]|uniref:PucR family transcriptional regulator n=1 Tax=Staphylospora marina TaxID=2490858 RepID=UPI000F5B9B37|nr:helix-turn-helix domain-containing protein [Staphylospora marina]
MTGTEREWLKRIHRRLGIRLRPAERAGGKEETSLFRLPSGAFVRAEEPLTDRERNMLAWLLEAGIDAPETAGDAFAEWVKQCLAGRPVPPSSEFRARPWNRRVILLMKIHGSVSNRFDEDLAEVARAYFAEGDPWIVSAGESLRVLMVPVSVLVEAGEDRDGSLRQSLIQAAEGWAEAVTSEAGRRVRLFVSPPVSSAEEAGELLAELGRLPGLSDRFSGPRAVTGMWEWETEKLVASLPPDAVRAFLRRFPPETVEVIPGLDRTLETLFRHDLNVSEAARNLFVHRNTLLYRLERFRQETGLDVRSFDDAVVAKLWLLLLRAEGGDRDGGFGQPVQ